MQRSRVFSVSEGAIGLVCVVAVGSGNSDGSGFSWRMKQSFILHKRQIDAS